MATPEERAGLRRIRRWRLWYWALFVCAWPAFAIAIVLVRERGWWFAFLLPALVLLLFQVVHVRANRSRCPRCGELFFFQKGPLGPTGTTLPGQRECAVCRLSPE